MDKDKANQAGKKHGHADRPQPREVQLQFNWKAREVPHREVQTDSVCPECNYGMRPLCGCFFCPSCGYSPCE